MDIARRLTAGQVRIDAVAVQPGGPLVAVAVRRSDLDADANRLQVELLDRRDGRHLGPVDDAHDDRAPRWSPDGTRLAVIRTDDGRGRVWCLPADHRGVDHTGGAPLEELPGSAMDLRWRPDGGALAVLVRVSPDVPGGAPRPVVVRASPWKADGVGRMVGVRTEVWYLPVSGDRAPHPLLTGSEVLDLAWSPTGRLACTVLRDAPRDPPSAVVVVDPSAAGPSRPRIIDLGDLAAGAVAWLDDTQLVLVARDGGYAAPGTLWRVDVDRGSVAAVPRPGGVNLGGAPMGNGAPGPVAVDDGRAVLVGASPGATVQLLRVDVVTGTSRTLLPQPGDVLLAVDVDPVSGDVVVGVADRSSMGEVVVLGAAGGRSRFHAGADLAGACTPEPFRCAAADGVELGGWLYRPAGAADPAPLVLDIHGGPHAQWLPVLDEVTIARHELAARGIAVLALNPRGSDGVDDAFRRGVLGAWGEADEGDWHAAVDALVAAGVADPDRLGVMGYSYGGFMTAWLLARSDRFRAGVAGGSVCDLRSLAGTADVGGQFLAAELGAELHDDPARYDRLSPLRHVDGLTAPLLLLHAEDDLRCPLGQAEQLFTALHRRGRTTELVVYPGASHAVRRDGLPSHRLDMAERTVTWFVEHLAVSAGGVR